MNTELEHEDWSGTTQGNRWMHRTLVRMMKVLNLRLVYLAVGLFVVPFYMLFGHRGYIAQYRYFRRRHVDGVLKAFGHVYLNHYRFGQIIIDRFAAYAGRTFHIECEGNDLFRQLADGSDGLVILSAHVGNYEMAGYTFKPRKRYNALVFSGEAQTVMENRNRILSENNIRMIPVSGDLSHVYLMNEALAGGEIVSIPADRVFGSPRYVECRLLGATVHLPLGPFALALQRQVPAVTMFVMKESAYSYTAYVSRVQPDEHELQALKMQGGGRVTRQQQATLLANAFARELEAVLRRYPEQWFNYFDFWQDDDNHKKPTKHE